MKELLTAIAKQMVDCPEQVMVNEIDSASSVILELSVAKQDMGKIIGAKGKNIGAIRTLISAMGAKHKKRVIIEVVE